MPDDGAQDSYLIWSHEHAAWWLPDGLGYTKSLHKAARYSHVRALSICANAIVGTAQRLGALPELPVREADVDAMLADYWATFPRRDEPWL